MGEILIAGMASLLICIFLGPKFIDFLRVREFGQHIREDGPAGHHEKAGTPTMGGLILFLAVSVPFLILTDYRAASQSPSEITASTISLLRPDRPSERRLEIFVQSSANPTSAVASAVASTTMLTAR